MINNNDQIIGRNSRIGNHLVQENDEYTNVFQMNPQSNQLARGNFIS